MYAYTYTLGQWLTFFFLYCIFGWCFESTYVSISEHRLVNRGFLTGPYIPIYGSGAVLVLFTTLPVRDNNILIYLVGVVSATVLEYITGVAMEHMFGVRYWDYSHKKFNFQGQICLESSLLWGVFTLLLVKVVQPPVERFVLSINQTILNDVVFGFSIIFVFDVAMSFRTAIDLRDMLIQAEKAKKEFQLMQKRVEVLEAVFQDSITTPVGNVVDGFKERVSEGKEKVSEQKQKFTGMTEEKMAELTNHMEALRQKVESSKVTDNVKKALDKVYPGEKLENVQNEIRQMRLRYENVQSSLKAKIHPRQLRMLRRNPSAKSLRYKDAWQYLKRNMDKSLEEYDKRKENTK